MRVGLDRLLALPAGRRAKWVVLAAWIAAVAGLATFALRLPDVTTNDVVSFLPRHSESTRVAGVIDRDFPSTPSTPAVIVYQNERGLRLEDAAAIVRDLGEVAERLRDVEAVHLAAVVRRLVDAVEGAASRAFDGDRRPGEPAPTVGSQQFLSPDRTTALVEIPIESTSVDVVEPVVDTIRDVVEVERPSGLEAYVSGPAGVTVDSFRILNRIGPTLLVATVALILVLLAAIYRSLLVPLLPLVTVGLAYVVAGGLVYLLVEASGMTLNTQAASLLVILMFGVGTDYSIYLVARYREELREVEDKHEAMARALAHGTPAVLSAGATVGLAMLALLAADLESTRNQGPVLAIGVAITMLAAVTMLPALLTVAGRFTFWPRRPGSPAWGWVGPALFARIGRLVAGRPVAVVAAGTLLLGGLAAAQVIRLEPLALDAGFRSEPSSLEGVSAIERAFPPGIVSPTRVIVQADPAQIEPATRSVVRALGADPAVVRLRLHSLDRTGGVAYVEAILDIDPYGDEAVDLVPRLRAEAQAGVRAADGSALVGGATAAQYDMIVTTDRDERWVFPLTLAVAIAVVGLLLRSLVAPLVLLPTLLLSFVGALGLSTLCFAEMFGAPGLTVGFSTFLFLFLVAFGVDYSIFLLHRIRAERAAMRAREAVERGLAATGGVILTAALILGGTFAMLMLLPLWQLFQIGFGVFAGVLLDALIVRLGVLPALVALLGDRFWWPGQGAKRRAGHATAPEGPAVPFLRGE